MADRFLAESRRLVKGGRNAVKDITPEQIRRNRRTAQSKRIRPLPVNGACYDSSMVVQRKIRLSSISDESFFIALFRPNSTEGKDNKC